MKMKEKKVCSNCKITYTFFHECPMRKCNRCGKECYGRSCKECHNKKKGSYFKQK